MRAKAKPAIAEERQTPRVERVEILKLFQR
jgi:hypothetical protein